MKAQKIEKPVLVNDKPGSVTWLPEKPERKGWITARKFLHKMSDLFK